MIYASYEVKDIDKKQPEELQRHKILCSECGKLLGSLVELKVPFNADHTKRIYQCYCVCGNECFPIHSINQMAVFTEPQYMLVDMIDTDNTTHIKLGKFK